MIDELYSDLILDAAKNPKNKVNLFKEKDNAQLSSFVYEDFNPFCGDRIKMKVVFSKGRIKEACFDGEGCAICTASADVLIDFAREKKIEEVLNIRTGDLLKEIRLEQLNNNPNRIKCVALPLKVLKMAVLKFMGDSKK